MGRNTLVALLISIASSSGSAANLNPGDILVLDASNFAVRRLAPGTGPLDAISQNGLLASGGPVAVEASGFVLVADQTTGNLLHVNPDTGEQTLVASGFHFVRDLALEPSGSLLVLDYTGRQPLEELLRVDPSTGAISQVSWPWPDVVPSAVAVDRLGGILLLDPGHLRVWRFDPLTGAGFSVTGFPFEGDCYPSDFLVEASGTILIAHACTTQQSYSWVERFDPQQSLSTVLSRGGDLRIPDRIALGAAGEILVKDSGDPPTYVAKVIRIDPVTGVQSVVYNGLDAHDLRGFAAAASGRIFLAGGGTGPTPPPIPALFEISRLFPAPEEIASLPNGDFFGSKLVAERRGTIALLGNLYGGSYAGPAIIRSDPATGTNSVVTEGGLLTYAFDFTTDENGDFLVAAGLQTIARVNATTGEQSMVAGGGLIQQPRALTRTPTGALFVLSAQDWSTNDTALIRIDSAGHQKVIVPAGTFANALRLAADSFGRILVADTGVGYYATGTVWRVTPSTGEVENVCSDPRLVQLDSIQTDDGGNVVLTTLKIAYRLDPETGALTPISKGAGEEIYAQDIAVVPQREAPPRPSCGIGFELAPILLWCSYAFRRRCSVVDHSHA
jgi:sugar lactone lactonase YvrE